MKKIELPITSNYASNWTTTDAVREIFQNAFDQEVMNPASSAVWRYDDAKQILSVSNCDTILPLKSLLLGETSKLMYDNTIGHFGEGYKIAMLVLLRNQKTVTIHNRGAGTVWEATLAHSTVFDAEVLMLTIKACKVGKAGALLTVEIGNITEEEYYGCIVPSNLRLQPATSIIPTAFGSILRSKEHSGKFYINGLFVYANSEYHFGYNFKVGILILDRDRKVTSEFEVKWWTSKMWVDVSYQLSLRLRIINLIETGAIDTTFVVDIPDFNKCGIAEEAFSVFVADYGEKAVPVSTQLEVDDIPEGYTHIIVTEGYKNLLRAAPNYKPPVGYSPKQRLAAWYNACKGYLPDELQHEFETITK